jgi:two-component system NarL family sensor kinase
MKNLKIFARLFLSHAFVGLLSIAALSIIVYYTVSAILIQRTLDQLSSINILKKDLVINYLTASEQNLSAQRNENKFLNLYNTFSNAGKTHSLTLPELDSIVKHDGFSNLYMFDKSYQLILRAGHDNFPDGLEKVIERFIKNKPLTIHIIDATQYASQHKTLLYYCVPVVKQGHHVANVLVEADVSEIQKILFENTGMGNTGESYLVGNDFTMRSSSRFFPGKTPSAIAVQTQATKKSMEGSTGQGILDDYRKEKVLSAYRPLVYGDLHWVIISEIDRSEAMQPIIALRNYLIIVTLIIIAITLSIAFLLSKAIAQPVLKLKEIIVALSKGVSPKEKPIITSTDEIGLMAKSVEELMEGLERTKKFASEIGAGNFNTNFATLSEHDELGNALIAMRQELQTFHEREIRSARERAAALLEGQEKERTRIINELHDGVGQLLTAIRMRVDALDTDGQMRDEIKAQINETIAEVRRISYNVMPQALVDFGLEAALKGLCENVRKYSSLNIDFRYVKEVNHILNFEITVSVFRIAQEGLNNIVKHANATQVTLHVLDKEDELYFLLEDNGKGFNENKIANRSGLGLRNIRERARLLNGQAEINSTPDVGTVIEVHIPMQTM